MEHAAPYGTSGGAQCAEQRQTVVVRRSRVGGWLARWSDVLLVVVLLAAGVWSNDGGDRSVPPVGHDEGRFVLAPSAGRNVQLLAATFGPATSGGWPVVYARQAEGSIDRTVRVWTDVDRLDPTLPSRDLSRGDQRIVLVRDDRDVGFRFLHAELAHCPRVEVYVEPLPATDEELTDLAARLQCVEVAAQHRWRASLGEPPPGFAVVVGPGEAGVGSRPTTLRYDVDGRSMTLDVRGAPSELAEIVGSSFRRGPLTYRIDEVDGRRLVEIVRAPGDPEVGFWSDGWWVSLRADDGPTSGPLPWGAIERIGPQEWNATTARLRSSG